MARITVSGCAVSPDQVFKSVRVHSACAIECYILLHSPLKVPTVWAWGTLPVYVLWRWRVRQCSVPAFPAFFGTL